MKGELNKYAKKSDLVNIELDLSKLKDQLLIHTQDISVIREVIQSMKNQPQSQQHSAPSSDVVMLRSRVLITFIK